jgi:hypothetical protein
MRYYYHLLAENSSASCHTSQTSTTADESPSRRKIRFYKIMTQRDTLPIPSSKELIEDRYSAGRISVKAYEAVREGSALHSVKPVEPRLRETEAILIAVTPDDSGSILRDKNKGNIIYAHNRVLEALNGASKERKYKLLFRTEYLNGHILNNWVHLEEALELNEQNYTPDMDK